MTEHTATPWRIGPKQSGDIRIIDGAGKTVAKAVEYYETSKPLPYPETGEANAAFIVKACNERAELVEAIRIYIAVWDKGLPTANAVKRLRDVLAKAQEG